MIKKAVALATVFVLLGGASWYAGNLSGKTTNPDTKVQVCHKHPSPTEAETSSLEFETGTDDKRHAIVLQAVSDKIHCGFLDDAYVPNDSTARNIVFDTEGFEQLSREWPGGGLLAYDRQTVKVSLVKIQDDATIPTSVFQAYPRVNADFSGRVTIEMNKEGELLIR
jgi:hypothetical protein